MYQYLHSIDRNIAGAIIMVEQMKYDPQKFVLKILYELGGVKGRTKLQKLIFLGQEELGLPPIFSFDKYHYGPYSWDLTEVIDDLVASGDIKEDTRMIGDYISYSYVPTKKISKSDFKDIEMSPTTIETLRKIKKLPLKSILSYVYRKYLPERVS